MIENKYLTTINARTINKIIDRYGYTFYIIKRISNMKCNCLNPLTKEADPNCIKCLGTGRKIKIYKTFGASREIKNPESLRSAETAGVTPKIFYIKGEIYINKDDLIVDTENIFNVFSFQYIRGEHGASTFTRLVCPIKKMNKSMFIRNFKELLNEHNIRK